LKTIPEIAFNDKNKENFGFEIIRLEDFMNHPALIGKLGIEHKLTFYAIMFIVNGNGKHSIDFKSHSYSQGSLIFISNEQVHAFSKDKNYNGYLILFKDEFLMKNLSPTEIRSFVSLYNYEIYEPVVQLPNNNYNEFLRLIQSIEQEYQGNSDYIKEDVIRNQLKVLLLKSERYKITNPKIINSKYYAEFIQLHNLIKVNIKTKYQVQFYADKLFMSTKKLNNITHEILGSSTKKVLSDIRVLKIKRSLMNMKQSIKEIAFEFGFDEHTNFVKFFKKHTGVTPSDFRELNQ